MVSLGHPRISNPVLSALQVQPQDRIISIKENTNADSNFILTHLIKQILYEKNKLCLVTLHNPIEHYHNVGKKLGVDLKQAIARNDIKNIDVLESICENIGSDEGYFNTENECMLQCLFLNLKTQLDELLKTNTESTAYLLIDDLSHFVDLNVQIDVIVDFVNYCINLIDNDRIAVILNMHVGNKRDEVISNAIQYVADVHVEVSPLKTGKSTDVTGVMTVHRATDKNQYHYKAFDRGIKTFHPGESIHYLYK